VVDQLDEEIAAGGEKLDLAKDSKPKTINIKRDFLYSLMRGKHQS